MIHAYLFILNIREANGGHGPNFVKIMSGINRTAGTNITVYHTFHDEVDFYKVHVWKCNGICQHRKPFNGLVKRTCNRAPGPNDIWWTKHQQTCGGVFQKISGPDPKQESKKKKTQSNAPKITNYLQNNNNSGGKPKSFATGGGGFGSKTTVVKPSAKPTTTTTATPTAGNSFCSEPGSNLRNVVGFKDLNGSGKSSIILSWKLKHILIQISSQHRLKHKQETTAVHGRVSGLHFGVNKRCGRWKLVAGGERQEYVGSKVGCHRSRD